MKYRRQKNTPPTVKKEVILTEDDFPELGISPTTNNKKTLDFSNINGEENKPKIKKTNKLPLGWVELKTNGDPLYNYSNPKMLHIIADQRYNDCTNYLNYLEDKYEEVREETVHVEWPSYEPDWDDWGEEDSENEEFYSSDEFD